MQDNTNTNQVAMLVQDFVKRYGGLEETSKIPDICGRVLAAQDEGNVCIKLEKDEIDLINSCIKEPTLQFLISLAPASSGFFVLNNDLLYTRRNWNYEQTVRTKILKMLEKKQEDVVTIPDEEAYQNLNQRQKEAVVKMCKNHFSILTGGPGTGKTFTIARAVKLALQMHPSFNIALAAPTGKAQERIQESIQAEVDKLGLTKIPKTSTLHSLLEENYDTVTFKHNKHNPLEIDWLIVDEASMIDLPLMAKLLDALQDDCDQVDAHQYERRLTLVGDPFQLASVEPGKVFGDLCRMIPREFICELNENVRLKDSGDNMGGITRLATDVKNGNVDEVLELLKSKEGIPQEMLKGEVYQDMQEYKQVLRYIRIPAKKNSKPKDWPGFMELIAKCFGEFSLQETAEGALEHLNDCHILCATRKGPFGCETMNHFVKRILEDKVAKENTGFKCPQPIMITKNSRSLAVSNGDVGVVMPENKKVLCLPGNKIIQMVLLQDNEMAFASTIHKAQGSEYKNVIIVLPSGKEDDEKSNHTIDLLTRELLYTAITRTKGNLFIFAADDEAVIKCCKNKTTRISGLCNSIEMG